MISFYELSDAPDLYYSVAYPNKPVTYKKLSFSHMVSGAVTFIGMYGEAYNFNLSNCENKWLVTNEEKGFVLKKTEREIIDICMEFNKQLKDRLLSQLDSIDKYADELNHKLDKYLNVEKLIEKI